MKNKKLQYKYFLILLFPLALLINILSTMNAKLTERVYSTAVYKVISQVISRIFGIFPFSVAEILVVLLVCIIIWRITVLIVKVVRAKSGRLKLVLNSAGNLMIFFSIIYFFFVVLWGLNYNRQYLSDIMGLEIRNSSVDELVNLCESLIDDANDLQDKLNDTDYGMNVSDGGKAYFRDALKRAYKGYVEAAKIYPELGGTYGTPTPVFLSELMSYTATWGIYVPFTAEANVNVSIPNFMIPSTACHEMAHQRGFAREDEANYIAYVTSMMHPDYDFQYSGTMLALIESMNALYDNDKSAYRSLYNNLSEEVRADLNKISEHNDQYESPVGEISSKVNDVYLKANNQKDGEKSYGRVVDLLLAEYRKKAQQMNTGT